MSVSQLTAAISSVNLKFNFTSRGAPMKKISMLDFRLDAERILFRVQKGERIILTRAAPRRPARTHRRNGPHSRSVLFARRTGQVGRSLDSRRSGCLWPVRFCRHERMLRPLVKTTTCMPQPGESFARPVAESEASSPRTRARQNCDLTQGSRTRPFTRRFSTAG